MKFFEKHVQWLALGIGAAYLLYMAYAYLGYPYIPGATMQLSAALGKNTRGEDNLVAPGEIDETIVKQIIVPLENAMIETKDTKRKLLSIDGDTITISDPAHGDAMSKPQKKYKVIPAPPGATEWKPESKWTSITFIGEPKKEISFNSLKKDVLAPEDKKEKLKKDVLLTVESNPNDPTTATKVKLEFPLVELVSETYKDQLNEGNTNASPLATAWFGSHQAGMEQIGPKIIIDNNLAGGVSLPKPPPAMPGPYRVQWTVILVPTGANDAAGKPVMSRKDVAYSSWDFTVDSAELDKTMKDAYQNVPNVVDAMFKPRITRVYLLRQELMSDGKTWSAAKIIDSVPNVALKPHPDDVKNGPPDKKNAYRDYKIMMEQEQQKIVTPPFPPEPADLKATIWTDPAAAAPPPARAGGPAAPAPAPAVAPGPAPVVPRNPAAPIVNRDFEILVHDITMEEGKTYRYAVKYRLYNSVFDGPQLSKATPPNIDIIFDVQSTPSPLKADEPKLAEADLEKLWSKPVTVEPRSRIFITRINQLKGDVQLSVFIWKDGVWREYFVKSPAAQSGDLVVANKSPTRWSVVDIRKDPQTIGRATPGNGWYALIMDDQGVISRRDEANDKQARDNFMADKKLAGGAAAAAVVPH